MFSFTGRLIINKDNDTPSTFLFSQLKWMSFPERVIYQKAIQMYKTVSGTSPNYLKIPFTFLSEYIQEHLDHLMKPNCIYRNQEFPGCIRNSSNLNLFKVRYLKWYQSSG